MPKFQAPDISSSDDDSDEKEMQLDVPSRDAPKQLKERKYGPGTFRLPSSSEDDDDDEGGETNVPMADSHSFDALQKHEFGYPSDDNQVSIPYRPPMEKHVLQKRLGMDARKLHLMKASFMATEMQEEDSAWQQESENTDSIFKTSKSPLLSPIPPRFDDPNTSFFSTGASSPGVRSQREAQDNLFNDTGVFSPTSASRVDWQRQQQQAHHGTRDSTGPMRPHKTYFLNHLTPLERTPVPTLEETPLSSAGLYPQRHFRVGWGPGGTFCFPSVNGTTVTINHVQVYPDLTEQEEEEQRQDVVSALQVHLDTYGRFDQEEKSTGNKSNIGDDEDQLLALCSAHIKTLQNLVDRRYSGSQIYDNPSVGVENCLYRLSVWHLIDSLWSERSGAPHSDADIHQHGDGVGGGSEYTEIYARKHALSLWLEATTRHEVLQDNKNLDTASARRIFNLLTGRSIEEACESAMELGDLRLATLLSQAGEDLDTQVSLGDQVAVWKNQGVWDLIDEDHQMVYSLLSGDTAVQPKLESWLRAFGLHLWYGQSAQNSSISNTLKRYNVGVRQRHAVPPLPPHLASAPSSSSVRKVSSSQSVVAYNYNDPYRYSGRQKPQFDLDSHVWDLRYGLIQLHCDAKTSLSKLLIPESSVSSKLDYSTSWHIHDVLALTSCHDFPGALDLFMNFVLQLELMGLWEWACYVVFVTQRFDKFAFVVDVEGIVRDLIQRNCMPTSRVEAIIPQNNHFNLCIPDHGDLSHAKTLDDQRRLPQQQAFAFLRSIGVPDEWIFDAQAMRAKYDKVPEVEFQMHLNARHYNSAHDLFYNELVCQWTLKEKEGLRYFLTILENAAIENVQLRLSWDRGCAIFKQYLDLLDEARALMQDIPEPLTKEGADAIYTLQKEMKYVVADLNARGLECNVLHKIAFSQIAANLCHRIALLDVLKSKFVENAIAATTGVTPQKPRQVLSSLSLLDLDLPKAMTENHRLDHLSSMTHDLLCLHSDM